VPTFTLRLALAEPVVEASVVVVSREIDVEVPDRGRAELFRAELEDTFTRFEDFGSANPRVRIAAQDRRLISALARILDNYVCAGISADINYHARKASLWASNATGAQAYERYFATWLAAEGGAVGFFGRHPLIRQMLTTVTNNFRENVFRACNRILNDWDDLGRYFFENHQLHDLIRFTTTGSDFHKGGQQVLLLTFRARPLAEVRATSRSCCASLTRGILSILDLAPFDELRLAYKPTDIERDCRLVGDVTHLKAVYPSLTVTRVRNSIGHIRVGRNSLSQIINRLCGSNLPVYRILPCNPGSRLPDHAGQIDIRQSYGYLQFLSHEAADRNAQNAGEVSQFFHDCGMLLAMSNVFGITDLHQENMIVHRRRPCLIDLEMSYFGQMQKLSNTTFNDALTNSNVSQQGWAFNPGPTYLDFAQVALGTESTKNRISWQGADALPRDYMLQLKTGFNKAIKCFRDDHQEFVDFMREIEDTVVRVIPYGTSFLQATLEGLHFGVDQYRNPLSAVLARLALPPITDAASFRAICLGNYGDGETTAWRGKARGVLESIDEEADRAVRNRALRFALDRHFHDAIPSFAVWTAAAADFLNGDVPAYYHKLSSRNVLSSAGDVVQVTYGPPDGGGNVLQLRTAFGWAASPSPFFHRPSVEVVINLLNRLGTEGFFFSDYLGECAEEIEDQNFGIA
jgi:hypothetical protein